MKIIMVSNFDDETVDDVLVCENIKNEYLAKVMLDALIDKCSGESSDYYFRVVEDNYKLYEYEW